MLVTTVKPFSIRTYQSRVLKNIALITAHSKPDVKYKHHVASLTADSNKTFSAFNGQFWNILVKLYDKNEYTGHARTTQYLEQK